MVSFEEVFDETPPKPEAKKQIVPASEERRLDAQEIEKAAATVTRPSAKIHLEALAKKLRKESEALKRVEASQAKADSTGAADAEAMEVEKPATSKPAEPPVPKPSAPAPVMPSAKYVPIDKFSFDSGEYNSPFVTIYVSLPSVGSIPRDQITCDFTKNSFDLIIKDLKGKSYRLTKDGLAHDIEPEKSKIVVKADKVLIKLAKHKSEYGSYDYWSDLVDKKRRKPKSNSDNPADGIMDLMKDMYDSGDDKMRKMIGETMEKQRRGELKNPGAGLDDMNI